MEEWMISSKKALEWFVEILGVEEWHVRRKGIVAYFKALNKQDFVEPPLQLNGIEKLFKPIAVYDDWMSWYMYLIESLYERPLCQEPFQSARIYSFFATIGRDMDALKKMDGIEQRIKTLLHVEQNKPDATLFELVVALSYFRNGWDVKFIPEQRNQKTADLEVTRSNERYYVECKRLEKINEYAEQERLEWQKRWRHLAIAMQGNEVFTHVNVVFKVPLEQVPEAILGKIYNQYIHDGKLNGNTVVETEELTFQASAIDMEKLAIQILESPIRTNSPQMIKLLSGDYDSHGSYTQIINATEICTYDEDDGLHILNQFYGTISQAWSAKWECIANESILKKAKDIKKNLSKAVSQIPNDGEGIIHIGYETVNGPYVEFRRHEKILETIGQFVFAPKRIEAIICHAIQPLVKIDEWECAETVIYFGNRIDDILPDKLLLAPPGTSERDSTHWFEDVTN